VVSGRRIELPAGSPTFCSEYVFYEPLGIAIDQWKPCALHLHHDSVTLLERMVHSMKINGVCFRLIGPERFGQLETFSETSSENLACDHPFVTAHWRIVGRFFR
jgi:hypothetical protein